MSSVHRNHRTTRQARRWGVVIGTATAAAADRGTVIAR